jgi:hypothetical protein
MTRLFDYPLAGMVLFLLWLEKHCPSTADWLARKIFEEPV